MSKTPTEIRSLARGHTETALNTLAKIMTAEDAPHSARVAAANSLLDRGWGKAPQELKVAVSKAARDLNDDELAAIAAGGSAGAAEAPIDPAQLN
jgi:hypothetical protein